MPSSVAIGIDFGTSYSHLCLISNDGHLIGDVAKNRAGRNPCNTIFNVGRLIGRKFDDPEIQSEIEHYPLEVFNKNDKPYIRVENHGKKKELAPEEILSMVLSKMKENAESYLDTTINNATITVPAYFNDSQRRAMKNAGTIAGLNVLRVLPHPSCAAIAYGLDNHIAGERKLLFFDLGGGTCDVSIIIIEEGIFEVRAAAGDIYLGGEDFDNRLMDHFAGEFKSTNKKDLWGDPRAICRLRAACQRTKHALSSATHTSIEIEALYEGIDFFTSLTRARFEELCQDLFLRVLKPIEKVLQDSKMGKSDVDDVVLVGGSTRIPRIIKIVSDFFNGKKPNMSINRDEAVAYGAAVQAAVLSGHTSLRIQDVLWLSVAPFSLGIAGAGGIMTPLIKYNTTVPTRKSEIFSTSSDNQPDFLVRVYEGNYARTKDNNFLGEVKLSDIPPAPRGVPQIEVTFDIDANDILCVSLCEKASGRSARAVMVNKNNLSREEIERMISEAEKFKAKDEAARACVQSKNDLESYAFELRNSVTNKKLARKFSLADRVRLEAVVDEIIAWLDCLQTPSKAMFDEKRMELENILNAIMQKPSDAASSAPVIDRAKPDPRAPIPSSISQSLCRALILRIIKDREKQARICSLSGDDAQIVMDYLHIVTRDADFLQAEERRQALSSLCKLAKSAKLFPPCYALTGVDCNSEPVAGGGSFAEVWKGTHEDKVLCLKIVRSFSKQENDSILRTHVQEWTLWAHLSHENVLPFYGVYLLGAIAPRICLVSPWMEKGNLRDYLAKFPKKPRMPFISDIVNGLAYLHGLQIIHGDLKAQNVLISDDEHALIADFGLSSVATTTTPTSTGGTTCFMAPELLLGNGKVTESCDIWSFACLCYEVLVNKLPFHQRRDMQIMWVMLRKEFPLPEEGKDGRNDGCCRELNDEVWESLVRCWNDEPCSRPDCKAIQAALKDLGYEDNRPEPTTGVEAGPTFWKSMREKSDNKTDFARLEEILLHILS